jgi:membrane fusion protein, heavy metal efflux system
VYIKFPEMKKLILICTIGSVLASCGHPENIKETTGLKNSKDTITISSGSSILDKLEKEKIALSQYKFELVTSGTVKAIPNNYALIAAPFAGRITRSFVRLGQEVQAGSPVFEISSPSYYETGKAYYQTKEEMYLAHKNLLRQKDLLKKGVGIQKDLEEAEVNYALKKKDFENAYASLKVFQVDTTNLVLGQPLIVRSPIKGSIVENKIVIGQYIREDSDPVATVTELSNIWVAGQVKEKDIRYITDTAEVGIKLIAFPEKEIKGRIYHINSIIDEDTRSIQVLIECRNTDRIMKPGMYVTAHFDHIVKDAIVIPSSAIYQMDDAGYVFLDLGKNRFLKRKIEILTQDNDKALIKSGLEPGEEIIINGGLYLLGEN